MLLLNQKNLRKTLQKIDKSKVIHLICNRNLHSVCSLFIFTQILKKELFKYQIEFRNMEKLKNFYFEVEEEEYSLCNEYCECEGYEINGIYELYSVAKSMNFTRVETVWPMGVCFEYYKVFTNESKYGYYEDPDSIKNNGNTGNNTGSNNGNGFYASNSPTPSNINNNINNIIKNKEKLQMCKKCMEIHNEILFSIKSLNCKFNGIFNQKSNRLDFLLVSSLSQCMKNDLRFMHEKKLFYSKSILTERKIGEFLAKRGISINASNENYIGLDSFTKKLCDDTFGLSDKIVFKNGHDLEITAVEQAFLILFYMYKEKDIFSYLCLEKRKLIDIEKACKFYYKCIHAFKEGILTASKLEDTILFKMKNEEFTIEQMSILGEILTRLFRIYLKYRNNSGEPRINTTYGDSRINKTNSTYGDSRINKTNSTYGDSRINKTNSTYGDSRINKTNSNSGDSRINKTNSNSGENHINNINNTNTYCNINNTCFNNDILLYFTAEDGKSILYCNLETDHSKLMDFYNKEEMSPVLIKIDTKDIPVFIKNRIN